MELLIGTSPRNRVFSIATFDYRRVCDLMCSNSGLGSEQWNLLPPMDGSWTDQRFLEEPRESAGPVNVLPVDQA